MLSTKCDVYDTSYFVVITILHVLQEACKLVSMYVKIFWKMLVSQFMTPSILVTIMHIVWFKY